MNKIKKVLVTGGAGYIGAVLVPKLLEKGYMVKVIDLYIYGDGVLDPVKDNPDLKQIKADIRDRELLERELKGQDAVIHLACISNDPSYDLDPQLGRSINYNAFIHLVDISKKEGVKRFIYASSSSVYGNKDEDDVTEDLPLEPLTDYSRCKALCEYYLLEQRVPGFVVLILRPATVCGYSPRLRLDLSVNILTNQAVTAGKILVLGGEQRRPNIHIEDLADLYLMSLEYPDEKIDGKIFNAGYCNMKISEIAEVVKKVVAEEMNGKEPEIITIAANDNRSYHICSEKIKRELGFTATRGVESAVKELCNAFKTGKIPGSSQDKRYYNIEIMREIMMK